eukprot:1146005-Pelagomonas_calceolata.AAC.2
MSGNIDQWTPCEILHTNNVPDQNTINKNAVSPLHHKAAEKNVLVGVWRVAGSTRVQNLAARSINVLFQRA